MDALSRIHADEALAASAKDASAAVRLGAWPLGPEQNPSIAGFLNDSDAFIVREAAEAINVPIEPALAPLAGNLASAGGGRGLGNAR